MFLFYIHGFVWGISLLSTMSDSNESKNLLAWLIYFMYRFLQEIQFLILIIIISCWVFNGPFFFNFFEIVHHVTLWSGNEQSKLSECRFEMVLMMGYKTQNYCFFLTLFIIWYSKEHKEQCFGKWICLYPQIKDGRHLLCWVYYCWTQLIHAVCDY
jgi:hypothetical protein